MRWHNSRARKFSKITISFSSRVRLSICTTLKYLT